MTAADTKEELLELLAQQTERELTSDETHRIAELLRSDDSLIDLYVDYLSIHGLLTWDAGYQTSLPTSDDPAPALATRAAESPRRRQQISRMITIAVVMLVLVGTWMALPSLTSHPDSLVDDNLSDPPNTRPTLADENSIAQTPESQFRPLELQNGREDGSETTAVAVHSGTATTTHPASGKYQLPEDFDDALVSTRIDELINRGLADSDVAASSVATDMEWVRRVYLTIAGRIPGRDESAQFLASSGERRRSELVDHVLNLPERSTNLAVVWTNLLVGRAPRQYVNRGRLYEHLRESFAANMPWIDMVNDLITARGRSDQNGATNFLIAHLNNQATPATAVTSRLFLGEQMSCVQCHDHPFAKGITQSSYWALNAFFKDTGRELANAKGRDSSMQAAVWKLVDEQPVPGPRNRMTTYETRSGRLEAVLPKYDGQTLEADNVENRREALATLLATDSEQKVARAMVNRMWSHFFGFGFTAQVDDMGPHIPVSHPELLELLTEAFVRSGYDLKRLMRWIACTDAWQRSSEMVAGNSTDRPDHGELPLFSRVYLQRMTPEQVYESVRVAIRSSASVPTEQAGADAAAHRHQWVQQFARTYDTDENDESLEFDGSIAQAMVMMNGADVTEAISRATQSIVSSSGRRPVAGEALQQVALAMLTRSPTAEEEKVFRAHHRRLAQTTSPATALPSAIEDMMWAYLNSSEFILIH